jgi:hypothetical protein
MSDAGDGDSKAGRSGGPGVSSMARAAEQFTDEPVIACGNFRRLGAMGNLLSMMPWGPRRRRSGDVPDYFYIAVTDSAILVIGISRLAPRPWMMGGVVHRWPRAAVKVSRGTDTYNDTDYSGLFNQPRTHRVRTLILEAGPTRIECQNYRETKGVIKALTGKQAGPERD